MSFEGYYQVLCENGHYSTRAYDYFTGTIEEGDCYECGAKNAWVNLVDDTNCDASGHIAESDLEPIEPVREEICPTCNQCRRIFTARYRIPSEAETNYLRNKDHL